MIYNDCSSPYLMLMHRLPFLHAGRLTAKRFKNSSSEKRMEKWFHQPHGHGEGDLVGELGICPAHKVDECADMPPLLFVQRRHILGNRNCAHIVPPTAYWDCRRSHSFFRMAYCTVFSYRGVPSGLFTKEMNSRNRPSRRIPSFSHRC